MKCRKSFWNMYKDSAVKKCQGIENDVKVVLKSRRQVFRKMDYKSVKISEDAKIARQSVVIGDGNYRA